MLFFRVMLCVAGLLLYLLIKELSDAPAAAPVRSAPTAATVASDRVPGLLSWDATPVGAFQPVAAKPAD